jgi:hypothetical protein
MITVNIAHFIIRLKNTKTGYTPPDCEPIPPDCNVEDPPPECEEPIVCDDGSTVPAGELCPEPPEPPECLAYDSRC